ncbi:hypothetical protein LSAT2_021255 [Lamellibrachia satsuma]|nr:hypothetical protein LSAT2_021255 [Lamellibrachia satsuma]
MAHGTIEIEKEILLSNIQTLADKTQEVHVTTDGSFLILADQLNYDLGSHDLDPPIREVHGDGDERKVEGAECESEA